MTTLNPEFCVDSTIVVTREIVENSSGDMVGAPITATDADSDDMC